MAKYAKHGNVLGAGQIADHQVVVGNSAEAFQFVGAVRVDLGGGAIPSGAAQSLPYFQHLQGALSRVEVDYCGFQADIDRPFEDVVAKGGLAGAAFEGTERQGPVQRLNLLGSQRRS